MACPFRGRPKVCTTHVCNPKGLADNYTMFTAASLQMQDQLGFEICPICPVLRNEALMCEVDCSSPALDLFHRPQSQPSLLAVEMTHLLQIWQGLVPGWSHHDPLMGQQGEEILGTWGFGKLKWGHSLRRIERTEICIENEGGRFLLVRICLSKLNC